MTNKAMTINKVIFGTSQSGDATVLQPAQPLSPKVKAALFDQFTNSEPAPQASASAQTIFFGALLAAILAAVALYVIKQIRSNEFEK